MVDTLLHQIAWQEWLDGVGDVAPPEHTRVWLWPWLRAVASGRQPDARWQEARHLDLGRAALTDGLLRGLAESGALASLRHLTLRLNAALTPEALSAFFDALPTLKSLHLSMPRDAATLPASWLDSLETLTTLRMDCFSPEQGDTLLRSGVLSLNPSLETLSLTRFALEDPSALVELDKLRSLSLSQCHGVALGRLLDGPVGQRLRALSLTHPMGLTLDGLDHTSAVHLERLSVAGLGPDRESWLTLSRFIRRQQALRHFELSHADAALGEAMLESVANQPLETVNLALIAIGPKSWAALAQGAQRWRTLSLVRAKIEASQAVATLKASTMLEHLALEHLDWGGERWQEAMEALCSAGSSLRSLSLVGNTMLKASALDPLWRSVSWSSLEHLGLRSCTLGGLSLPQAMAAGVLRVLDLSDTWLSFEGKGELLSAELLPKLKIARLDGHALSDSRVPRMESWLQSGAVRVLGLSEVRRWSHEALKRCVKAALSGLYVLEADYNASRALAVVEALAESDDSLLKQLHLRDARFDAEALDMLLQSCARFGVEVMGLTEAAQGPSAAKALASSMLLGQLDVLQLALEDYEDLASEEVLRSSASFQPLTVLEVG